MEITREQQPALSLFATGMAAMGVLGLVYGDFAMVWQPVPAGWPARTALAYAAAIVMLLGGIGLILQRTARWAIRVLFVYAILWTALKVPALVVAPKVEGVWLGFGELAVMLAGAWTLFATLDNAEHSAIARWIAGERGVRAARILFGIFILPIGLAHLMYAKETAALVPAWLGWGIGWAWMTGLGQIACGLGVLFGVLPRLAAMTEAAMISLFGLLVWLPAIVAKPTTRLPWTAFLITWVIAAGAWVVAQKVPSRKTRSRESAVSAVA